MQNYHRFTSDFQSAHLHNVTQQITQQVAPGQLQLFVQEGFYIPHKSNQAWLYGLFAELKTGSQGSDGVAFILMFWFSKTQYPQNFEVDFKFS